MAIRQWGRSLKLWKRFENLTAQTSPNHLCALQVGPKPPKSDIAKKTLAQIFEIQVNLIWANLDYSCHLRSVGNSNFHGERSKRIALTQMYSKRSPDRNAGTPAPENQEAHTFCSHQENLDHVCMCIANRPSSGHASPNEGINYPGKRPQTV